jgi:hypothetical protein
VASALIRMGATTGPVDEVKFGKELQIVIEKVTQMAPDIIVASTPDGMRLLKMLVIQVNCIDIP